MQVLKVVLEGAVTSFRYPHFMLGVQPSFPMPPPATIYGHICSAVGDWIDPASVRFAYHFTHQGTFIDLEHIHAGGWAEPIATRRRKDLAQQGYPDLTLYGESTVTPFNRELLFRPRLELYLDRPDLEAAFRSPHYSVILGRSQDLCTYPPGGVQVVTLAQQDNGYYAHTLLPLDLATRMRRGVAMMMPRFIDGEQGRRADFAQYLVLDETVFPDQMQFFGSPEPVWCDPTAPILRGYQRVIVWHGYEAA